jgi:hypothetical protein
MYLVSKGDIFSNVFFFVVLVLWIEVIIPLVYGTPAPHNTQTVNKQNTMVVELFVPPAMIFDDSTWSNAWPRPLTKEYSRFIKLKEKLIYFYQSLC